MKVKNKVTTIDYLRYKSYKECADNNLKNMTST